MSRVSVVIPADKEKYLTQTIEDFLKKATGDIEIIAVCQEYWPTILNDPRVHYIHFTGQVGMRQAINTGVAVARGEYILKTDAHTMVGVGYDEIFKADCQDDTVLVPRRLRLDPEKWELCDTDKEPMDYMLLTSLGTDPQGFGGDSFHGREWRERNRDLKLKAKLLDETPSFQGSSYFMKRSYWDYLELLDHDNFGHFPFEAQEVAFKCFLSGGRVLVTKKTWIAHYHKGREGRGYHLSKDVLGKGAAHLNQWYNKKMWHKQTLPLSALIERFPDMPTWSKEQIAGAHY